MAWNERFVSVFHGDDTIQWNKRDLLDGETWYGDAGSGNKYYFEDTVNDFRPSITVGARIVWSSANGNWKNGYLTTYSAKATMIVARIVANVDADYDAGHPYRVELINTADGAWAAESNLGFYILKNGGTSYADSYASPNMATSTYAELYGDYELYIGSGLYGPSRCLMAPEYDFQGVVTAVGYARHSIYIDGFVIFDSNVGDIPSGYDPINCIGNGGITSGFVRHVYGNGNLFIKNFISGFGIEFFGYIHGVYIDNCLHAGKSVAISGQPGVTIENCIWSNILSWACDLDSHRTGEKIQNNSFVNINGYVFNSIENRADFLLRNNIFNSISGKPYDSATALTAKQIDYNCYYDVDDLTEMPEAVGPYDVHSNTSNPEFLDADNLNFALEDGSPCARPAGYTRDKIGAIGGGFATSNSVLSATWKLSAVLDGVIDTPPLTNPQVVSGTGWVPTLTGTMTPDLGCFDDPIGAGAGNFVYNQSPVDDNSLVSPVFDVGVSGNFRRPLLNQLQVDSHNLFGLQIAETPITLRLEMRVSTTAFAQNNGVIAWIDADSGSVPYGTDLHDTALADNQKYVQFRVSAYRTK